MKRVFLAAGLLLLAAPLYAQTPTGVAFDVNLSDHSSSIVSGYRIYVLAGSNRVRVADIGKPSPDNRTISYRNPDLFAGLQTGSYSVHATAYGPGGESRPSNSASFSVSLTDSSGSIGVPEAPSNTRAIYEVPNAILVQAEDYENYRDLSSANEGYAYRNDGVDIEVTADDGGGYNVGWIAAGEWLSYTANVPAAGVYEFQVRVASLETGGTFHVEVNGVNVTGPLAVPKTGGWQNWTTLRRSGVKLPAGRQTWKIVFDEAGQNWRSLVGNVNWIAAVPH